MRRAQRIVTALMLPALFCGGSVACAGEGRSYLGAQAGMFLPIESQIYGGGIPADAKITYHPGVVLSGVAGYQFAGGIRAEAEFDYRRLKSDRLDVGASTTKIYSDIENYSVMGNVYYDFLNKTAVTPYVGGGVGFAATEFGTGSSNGSRLWSDDRDFTIAYQAIGGFAVRLTESTTLDFIYRHYAIPRLHFDTLSAQFRGPNLSVGLRHWF